MKTAAAAAKTLFAEAAKKAALAALAYREAPTEGAHAAYLAAMEEENTAFRRYVHFGTGNTHPFTTR